MAAAVVIAVPMLLLACSAIFQTSPDLREVKMATEGSLGLTHGTTDLAGAALLTDAADSDVEQFLLDVLRRCDAHTTTFLRHRALAARFIAAATAHLRTLSPLLANTTGRHDGSAFEGTRATDNTDFDAYALLDAALLRHFELQRGTEGRIAARLRPGVDRGALPADLAALLTRDGYLSAWRFKRWTFARLEATLRRAAAEYSRLRPVVYATHGAVGVNLTTEDGAIVQIDYAAHLVPPPTTARVLRPASLRPCHAQLVPPGHAAAWTLYSEHDLASPAPAPAKQRWFIVNAMQLEHDLLSAQPLLRSITRLLKALSAARRWHQRFHVGSFMLKHAVFWSYAEVCEQWRRGTSLVLPMLASLRTFEQALRRGRLDKFFDGSPAENALDSLSGDRSTALLLADEVHDVITAMRSGNTDTLRRLFQF